MGNRKDATGGVQSVDRAIDILSSFSVQNQNLSLKELAEQTGLNKITVYRLATTLKRRGLLHQDSGTKLYSLGSELMVYAAIKSRQTNLVDVAIPAVRKIRDATNETASLAVRLKDLRMNIYQLESLHPVRRGAYSGEPSPLYAGSSKLLLAAMSNSEIEEYFERANLTQFTPFTLVDKDALWQEIEKIREVGYSESFQERFIGAASLAVPIRDANGDIVAAVYISAPVDRYNEELRKVALAALCAGAEQISSELGHRKGHVCYDSQR